MASVNRRAVPYLALVAVTALLMTGGRASAAQLESASQSPEAAPATQYALPHVQADLPINVVPSELKSSFADDDIFGEDQPLEHAVADLASSEQDVSRGASAAVPVSSLSSSSNAKADEGAAAEDDVTIVFFPMVDVDVESTWEEALEAEQAWEANAWDTADAAVAEVKDDEENERSVETALGTITEQTGEADTETAENAVVVEVYQVATAAPANDPDSEPTVVSESLEVSYFVPDDDDATGVEQAVDEAMARAAENVDAYALAAAVIGSEFDNYDVYYSNPEAEAVEQPLAGDTAEYMDALAATGGDDGRFAEAEAAAAAAAVAAAGGGRGGQDTVERMLDDLEASAMIVGALLSQQAGDAAQLPAVHMSRRGLRPGADAVAALQAVPVTETTARLVVNVDLYRVAVIAFILTCCAMIAIRWSEAEDRRHANEEQLLPYQCQCCPHSHHPNTAHGVSHEEKFSQTNGCGASYAPIRETGCQTKA